MIELPEAFVLARQVENTLAGRCVVSVTANQSPHKFAWFTGDPATYPNLLVGKTAQSAAAYGNHVEIRIGDQLLVINTPIKFHIHDEIPPNKHQLLVRFDDQSYITCTVVMWGGLFCFTSGEQGGLVDYQIAKEEPSPLNEGFDRIYFHHLSNEDTCNLSAKAFLATGQRIPGLGNGTLQDILWTARVHPRSKMVDLSGEDIDRMFAAVKSVLNRMAAEGGRDTERDLFNQPGGYKTILSNQTAGTPCPVCGSRILKEAYLGGSIYFCSSCQKTSK